MPRYALGEDVGSSGYKAVLLDLERGEIKATVNIPYQVNWVRPNWAQQDPQLWKDAFIKGTRKLLEKSRVRGDEIEGLAFSGQQHGAVLLNKDK